MGKEMTQERTARIAAEIASKTALDFYEKEKLREKKIHMDRRLHNTKRLMRNYREIKIHAEDSIASLAEMNNEDYSFFRNLMEDRTGMDVSAIVASRAKSAIMLKHINTMLSAYREICYSSKRPEDARRYRVLESLCLCDVPVTVQEVAERENIDPRTVYKDFDVACEKMSALLFGIQWIDHE